MQTKQLGKHDSSLSFPLLFFPFCSLLLLLLLLLLALALCSVSHLVKTNRIRLAPLLVAPLSPCGS